LCVSHRRVWYFSTLIVNNKTLKKPSEKKTFAGESEIIAQSIFSKQKIAD